MLRRKILIAYSVAGVNLLGFIYTILFVKPTVDDYAAIASAFIVALTVGGAIGFHCGSRTKG